MAQVRQVVSESLQATIRRLLPSQQGFTEDLQATNVITPIIDLTPTAEGSLLGTELQQAQAFGSQTAISIDVSSSSTVINSAGFFRLIASANIGSNSTTTGDINISMSDGLASKIIYQFENFALAGGTSEAQVFVFDQVFYVNSGESVTVTTNSLGTFRGSVRQIADVTGNLVNPSGFVQQ